MVFPVSQSVLDADALANELKERYGLTGEVKCRLISRGMNDIYRIEHAHGPHALKVARTGKSTDDEFAYEQDYILHLAQQGLTVPTPVATREGAFFFAVDAPEGHRQIVLMAWLEGEPYPGVINKEDAARLGQFLAHMHTAAVDFETAHKKAVATDTKIQSRLHFLLELVKDRPGDADFLEHAAAAAVDRFQSLKAEGIASGPCHGDLQNANVMKRADGSFAVFDFSDCGTDVLAKDIAAFYWRNDFEGLRQDINDAFVSGYDEVRPLTPDEREAQPLFRVLRHLLITSTMAQHINRVGPVRGFDKDIGVYMEMIRTYCVAAGIP